MHSLGLAPLVQRLDAVLPPVSRVFHPAEGDADGHAVVVVQEDHAGVDGAGGAVGQDGVLRVDAAGEAVGDGVCEVDCGGGGGEGGYCCCG